MGFLTRKSNEKMNAATNAANLQMNAATNAANQAINQANIDYAREAWNQEVAYNWEMWNKTNQYNEYWYNQYNSPEAMMRQYKEAGINPYLADLGQGSSSSGAKAGSAPSHGQPSQIPMQPGSVQPYYHPEADSASSLGAVSNSLNTLNGTLKNAAEVNSINISNQYLAMKSQAEIANILANTRGVDTRTKGQAIENLVSGLSANARVMSAYQNNSFLSHQMSLMTKQIRAVELENMAKEARVPYLSQYAQAELDSIVLNNERIERMTDAEVAHLYASAYESQQRALNLPKLNEEQRVTLGEMMVKSAKAAAGLSQNELFWSNKERLPYEEGEKMLFPFMDSFYNNLQWGVTKAGKIFGAFRRGFMGNY